MNSFTIKDIAELSGIKTHTLRIWESRYDFLSPGRSDTNIRRYSNEELKIILNIALLNRNGFKISQLSAMSDAEMQKNILALTDVEEDRVFNQLLMYMFEMKVFHFEKLLSKVVDEQGLEKTMTNTIWPFMEKVGLLWSINHLVPAQEHLITVVIRQKIIAAIDDLPLQVEDKNPMVIYLPEGEYHEIGALFLYYILKKNKIPVIYLGANVPLDDVIYVSKESNPGYLCLHLTAAGKNFNIPAYINTLTDNLKSVKVLLSGRAVSGLKINHPNVIIVKSFTEMKNLIEKI